MPQSLPSSAAVLESSELEEYLRQGIPYLVTDIEIQGDLVPPIFKNDLEINLLSLNTASPGGKYAQQSPNFSKRLANLG